MSAKIGIASAATAFAIFGIYPVYFKQLPDVPPFQLACHRMLWSFVTLLPLFLSQVEWKTFRGSALQPKVLGAYFVSGIAIGGLWLLYQWGITKGHIIEISLGFFMNPIFTVLAAVFVLKERLRVWQWVSVGLAILGVLVIAIAYGKFPWLSISIGSLLALYGFVKSTTPLTAVESVTIEMAYLFLPALAYLVACQVQGTGAFGHVSATQHVLLVLSGVVTVVPLLLFGYAAHLIPFSLLGLIQYIGPMLNFILGAGVYHEPFSTSKLIGFILVWLALATYGIEGLVVKKPSSSAAIPIATPTESDLAAKDGAETLPSTPTGDFSLVELEV
ncbi:hypothetical protein LEN26_004495, partial [Aphanomyces euteiches]